MEDGKNTYQEWTGNNLQQKQSEGGVECDENNRAGSQTKRGTSGLLTEETATL